MKLARRTTELAESATLAVTAKAARMKAEGIDIISLAAGEPDFDTPASIKRDAIAAIESGRTRYAKPTSGLIEAKRAVCSKLARDNQLSYVPEQIIITNGGKMALYLAVQAVIDPADEVIVPKPYWVSYPEMVKLAGGVPVFITGPEDRDYKLTPERLRTALTDRTKAVFLNSPCNPSGVTYAPAEIRALADVLQEHDLWIMSDEIYDRLVFHGQQTLSYAAVNGRAYAQTITVNSASKTYAMTGWRLGYAAGPTEVIRTMAKLQSQMTSGAVTFNQAALASALDSNQPAVETMRAAFERRGRYMYERLRSMPGLRCPQPTGAFFCFPNMAAYFESLGVSNSAALADLFLDRAKVAVVPGAAFGMDEHVRLSFATGMDQIEEGLSRIEALLQ